MILTIAAWIAIAASAVLLLFAKKISERETMREGLQIISTLVFCFVGTSIVSTMPGVEAAIGDYSRPWRIISLAFLALTLLLYYLSRYIK